jgi:hypothetical protein
MRSFFKGTGIAESQYSRADFVPRTADLM